MEASTVVAACTTGDGMRKLRRESRARTRKTLVAPRRSLRHTQSSPNSLNPRRASKRNEESSVDKVMVARQATKKRPDDARRRTVNGARALNAARVPPVVAE
jgi:hypothetical protein